MKTERVEFELDDCVVVGTFTTPGLTLTLATVLTLAPAGRAGLREIDYLPGGTSEVAAAAEAGIQSMLVPAER